MNDDKKHNVIEKDITDIVVEGKKRYSLTSFQRHVVNKHDHQKIVNRRILYILYKLYNHVTVKCASVVGDIMKLHPHGDVSIYDAMINLSLDFDLNHPLVKVPSNNGDQEGSPPAAMRYTEIRLAPFGRDVYFSDFDANSINMIPSYDDRTTEPAELSPKIPLVLVNGTFGMSEAIQVSIPSHNLRDVALMVNRYINNKNISLRDLTKNIYPDYPTGGIITNGDEIREFYATNDGKGSIKLESKIEIDNENNRIIVREFPHGVTIGSIKQTIQMKREINGSVLSNIASLANTIDKNDPVSNKFCLQTLYINCIKGSNLVEIKEELEKVTQLRTSKSVKIALNDGNNFIIRSDIKGIIKLWYEGRVQYKRRYFINKRTKIEAVLYEIEAYIKIRPRIKELIDFIMNFKDKSNSSELLSQAEKDNRLIRAVSKEFDLSLREAEKITSRDLKFLAKSVTYDLESKRDSLKMEIEENKRLINNIDKIILDEVDDISNRYGRDRRTDIIMSKTDNISDNISISSGSILFSHTQMGIFNNQFLLKDKISLNDSLKSVKIDGKNRKDILGNSEIFNNILGVLIFFENETAKIIKAADIKYTNQWIVIGSDDMFIKKIIPIYDFESEVFILSKQMKGRRILLNDIGLKNTNIGEISDAVILNNDSEKLLLINDNLKYVYTDITEFPIQSKNSLGVQTSFDESMNLKVIDYNDDDKDLLAIGLYNNDDIGFFYTIKGEMLVSGKRTSSLKTLIDSKDMKLNSIEAIDSNKKDSNIMIYGNFNKKNLNIRNFKYMDMPKQVSLKPIGFHQL